MDRRNAEVPSEWQYCVQLLSEEPFAGPPARNRAMLERHRPGPGHLSYRDLPQRVLRTATASGTLVADAAYTGMDMVGRYLQHHGFTLGFRSGYFYLDFVVLLHSNYSVSCISSYQRIHFTSYTRYVFKVNGRPIIFVSWMRPSVKLTATPLRLVRSTRSDCVLAGHGPVAQNSTMNTLSYG